MMLSPCYCQPLDQLDYSISHKMPNDYIPENIENLDLGWAAGLGWDATPKKFLSTNSKRHIKNFTAASGA